MKYTKIRTDIKQLVDQQVVLKPQRKTIHFTGIRTVEADQATYNVFSNREKLRHLYEAYAVLKGKERQKCVKKEISQSLIDKYILEYTE